MATPTYTLLIVEDFPEDRERYRRCLLTDPSCTYCLLEVESVEEGLELCRTQAVDAVLLDYMLPDADGLEFIRSLLDQSNGNSPPIVMVTGEGHERIAVQAIKMGAEDYLVKRDLTPKLLQSTLRSAIENTRLRLQLQQCRERFQISVDNMLDCFGIYSAIRDEAGQITDFRFEYLNAAALESNRMTASDLGKGLFEVFPSTHARGLFEEYCQVVETGEPLVKEDLAYSDVFGVQQLTRAYDVRINKLNDGFVASWRDVTARKLDELKLQEANQQLTTIWESMTDAYISLDPEWRVIYANQAATHIICHLTNLEPEAFLGKTHWELFPWSVAQIVEQEYRWAVAEQVAVHFEFLFEPAGRWFEIHAYPSAAGLGVYFRDISERKRAEAERIRNEQDRDRFFNLSIDMLAIANFEGYFIRLNPAWEQTLGFTPEELMAQPYLDLVHPDNRAATAAVTESLIAGNVLVNFENRYRCKDGSYRWILWSAMPDAERSLIYADGHDITDRKQAELNDRFLYELTQRLRQLTDAESIQWETVESLGEYLNVDRAVWFEVDEAQELATIDRDWYREGLTSHAGVYAIADFLLPELQAAQSAGSLVAISDVTTNPFTAPQIANYKRVGVGAFVSVPCIEEGRWVGTLNVNTTTARSWRDDEIELVQTVVVQLWSLVAQARGVQALRAQEQQTRAAQAIVEQQLREIETIYQTAPVGMSYGDANMRYVRINEQLAQINGLPIAAHIGRTIREVLPEIADQLEPLYRQVMESGEPILDLEMSGIVPSQPGTVRHWLLCYYPQKDAEGRVVGVNSIVQEITDRKQAEQRLRESEEQLRTGVEVAGVGLAKFDYATNLVELSPEAAVLYGFAPDTAVITREQIHATFHPDERAELEEAIAQVLDPQGQGWFAQDHRVVWPTGEVRCLSVRKRIFLDRSGEAASPSYAILAAIDVTDRKQDQAALEERNQELNSFVHVVSHDLKAPLRGITNLSQWIEEDLEGELSAECQENMTLLRSRVHRMETMIDGLLDYARIGRTAATIEPVVVKELLAEVIDSVAPPPTFHIHLAPNLPTLQTKRLWLYQVFANLIGNGVKHHNLLNGCIRISHHDRGDFYEFVVADDGPGIAPEYHDKIFMIFQVGSTEDSQDSSGIGLSIVKKIVETERGTIRLESEPGKGTTFYFTWPKH
jgi:PAS domain S-box-containing protein